MSVELRDVKRRINSTSHIGKVTSALQRVASAKLARATRKVAASTKYTVQLARLLHGTMRLCSDRHHPLLRNAGQGTVCLVVFGSDRGLCGGYNSAVMDRLNLFTAALGRENVALLVVGTVPRRRAQKQGFTVLESHTLPPVEDRSAFLDKLSAHLARGFTRGEFARVTALYTHFVSPLDKPAVTKDILPFTAPAAEPEAGGFFSKAFFDPSPKVLVDRLLPEALRQTLDFAFLHSICSEDAYRQEAMMRASENARAMLKDLRLQYSRLRQENITTEMLEIAAAGFAGAAGGVK